MRWIWILFLTTPLFAVQPLYQDYSDQLAIFGEVRNITDNAQDQQFTVVNSTPNLSDMKDGGFVFYASTANNFAQNQVHIILRQGTTLYFSQDFKLMVGR